MNAAFITLTTTPVAFLSTALAHSWGVLNIPLPKVTANDEYKLKQWNADSKSCRRTTLGPTFGGPITCLEQIKCVNSNGHSGPSEFAAYGTAEKVVGLVSKYALTRAGTGDSTTRSSTASIKHYMRKGSFVVKLL